MDETKGRILVVDDEAPIREIISRKLSADGYEMNDASEAETALKELSREDYDCVLSDIHMPGMDGVELLRRIRVTDQDIAVILITGAPDMEAALEAMRLGAYDHLSKPLNLSELALTVERAIEKKRLVEENRAYQRDLESMVRERTQQLAEANEEVKRLFMSSIKALAQALEAKDEYTQGHSARVAELGVEIARYVSLPDREIQNIWLAGLLHDIGKIGIRENVLNKPGKLDPDEWESVQQHPVVAGRILGPIEELGDVIDIVVHHHERFDGSGYPEGLKGSDIPLGARILSVADAYDALTSKRPYRDALPDAEAVSILEDASSTQFDPVIVRSFVTAREGRGRPATSPTAGAAGTSMHDANAPEMPSPAAFCNRRRNLS
ncbi:MAG: response regulator [Candidatus Eisenbacteria bacterium]|nr:response regulator [Candidatus Eisenbacteria bacterium]